MSSDPAAGDHPFVVPAFLMTTGIECSAPLIRGGVRNDQLARSDHRSRYREDAALVRDLGVTHLRYGIPFHAVAHDPARFDWSWTDLALEALRDEGIEPIADLLHFGVPDDLFGVGDPRLPARFEAFAAAFARRYRWIRWYTPVNELFITALSSTRRGWWNERRTDDASFVAAIDSLAAANLRGIAAIRDARPDAIVLQTDTCEAVRPAAADPATVAAAHLLDELRFIGFDLTLGRRPAPSVVDWLTRNGLDDARLGWFEDRAVDGAFIVGLDHYDGNERIADADGRLTRDADPRGFASLARDYHARYGRPFMLAETNQYPAEAEAWLEREWYESLRLLEDGLPLVGFCWYSLTDQVDWDTCLREDNHRVTPVGLAGLDRRLHPVGRRYRDLIRAVAAGRFEPLEDATTAA